MENNYRFRSSAIRNIGYFSWAIMLLFAVLFYKERATFMDGAFQLFELINTGEFQIYHYRFTNPLTQILALAAIKLQLPLKWVMIAYSVNFILLFVWIYWLIVEKFENDLLGWGQIFFFTLLGLDSFFFLTPEFYQGISLLFLLFAILLKYPQFENKYVFPGLLLLCVPIIFAHKLTAVFFLFLWIFFWLENQNLRHWKYYVLLAFVFVLIAVHSTWFTDWYDSRKSLDFMSNAKHYFPRYWEIPSNWIFLKKIKTIYYFYPIFLMILIAGYCYAGFSKRIKINAPFLKLGLILAANLGYLLIVHIGSPPTKYRFYSEVNYLPLAILVSVPLLVDFLSKIKKENFVAIGLAIIIFLRLNVIFHNQKNFVERHNWLTETLGKSESLSTNRLMIAPEKTPQKQMIMNWPIPQETALLSALESPKATKTLLITAFDSKFKKPPKEENIFLTYFKKLEIETLNPHYFQMKANKYVEIK